jgi:hypothetical protein
VWHPVKKTYRDAARSPCFQLKFFAKVRASTLMGL